MRISDLIASLQRTMATMGDLEVDATVSVVMIEPVLDEPEPANVFTDEMQSQVYVSAHTCNAQQLQAAKLMLAALQEALPFVCAAEEPWSLQDRRTRLAQWRKLKDVIEAAKQAGIE